MDEEFLLAINGDWDELLPALRDNRTLAHQTDANGMTLLHWVCLHQDIPTEVLIKIVFANPHAVNVPNEAGHLPIDLAVQAECEERILEVLRAADKSRQEHEPEPAPPVAHAGGGAFSPSSHGGPYGYDYPEEEDMTFENPRYFANPAQQQHQQHLQHPQQRDPYGSAGQARHHLHDHHHQLDEEHDHFDAGHGDPYGRSDGGTPHHQLDLRSRHTPTRDEPSAHMQYGVARKPLFSIYSGQTNPGEMQSKSMSLAEDRFRGRNFDAMSVATEDFNAFRGEAASDSHVLHQSQSLPMGSSKWEPKGGAVTKGTSFPPRWKQSRSCHVCTSRFTLTHRRHHCRNCGFSVCGQHSTNRVPLPRFGLGEPQRVCDKCFLAGRHVFGMGPIGSAGSVVMGGGGAMSVVSGSDRHYEPQQHYGSERHYDGQPQYGRRDSFGSYRP